MALVLFVMAVVLTLTIDTFIIFCSKEALRDLIPRGPLFALLTLDAIIENLWQVIGMVTMYRWLRKDH